VSDLDATIADEVLYTGRSSMNVVIVTMLPILVPLAAAIVNSFLPFRVCRTSLYRLVRLFFMIAIFILYMQIPALTTGSFTLSLSVPGLIALPPLAFLYTNIGIAVGLIYICGSFFSILGPMNEETYSRRTLDLVMVSCVLATCLAANITTLCFCWMVLTVFQLMHQITLLSEDRASLVYWDLSGILGSLILVMTVSVLAIIQQRTNTFSDIADSPFMVTLLLLSVLLRLGVFPLPGNRHLEWMNSLALLCTGIWPLLRVASVSLQSFPGWKWLVPLIAASSVITALLANLAATGPLRRSYVIASLVSVLLLAPFLAPVSGAGLAVLGLTSLVLVASLLELTGDGMTRVQGEVFKWLRVVAILTLMGVPFTLGFLGRWELAQLVNGTEQQTIIIMLTINYTLVMLYFWRQVAWEMRKPIVLPHLAGNQSQLRVVENWVICGLGTLFVLAILLIGVLPGSVNALLPFPLTLISPITNLSGENIATWVYLLTTTLVIPLAGAFFLYYQRSLFRLTSPLLELIRWFASLNWLYNFLAKILRWIYRQGTLLLNNIERKYLLGWVLLWMIIIVAFLVGT
jgi:hypothetical protein